MGRGTGELVISRAGLDCLLRFLESFSSSWIWSDHPRLDIHVQLVLSVSREQFLPRRPAEPRVDRRLQPAQ
jgi:hypothetical protein